MQTNISKVDESFVDYLYDSKLDSKYGKILSNLLGVKDVAEESVNDDISQNKELNTNFMVYFDIALFEAPPVIVKLEEKLAKNETDKVSNM